MEGRPLFHEGTLSTLNLRISIFFRNFERPFTPRGWLRSASNFGKTRFRRSPTFHFSTWKNIFAENVRQKFSSEEFASEKSANCLFWRSYVILDVTGSCSSKNDPRGFDFQLSTTFGRGVKVVQTIFGHGF